MDTLKDVVLVLLGGVCASLGGVATAWYKARTAGQVRFKETLGEQKAKVLGRTMRILNGLRSTYIQGVSEDVLDFTKEHNEWMLDNEGVLPKKAVENWHSVRGNVRFIRLKEGALQRATRDATKEKLAEEASNAWKFGLELVEEAEQLVRKELDLGPFRIHRWNSMAQ